VEVGGAGGVKKSVVGEECDFSFWVERDVIYVYGEQLGGKA